MPFRRAPALSGRHGAWHRGQASKRFLTGRIWPPMPSIPGGFVTNYIPWFSGDYLRDTLHLTWLEDLAYRRLLEVYYSTEAGIPGDEERIFSMVRAVTPEQQAAVRKVLKEFFRFLRGKWINNRAESEIRKREQWRERKQRQRDREKDVTRDVTPLSRPSPSPSPSPSPNQEKNKSGAGEDSAYIDRIFSPFLAGLGIPLSLFMQYKRMREHVHRPIVPGTEEHIFAQLTEMQAKGGDPIEILTFAIRHSSWKLTLPPNPNGIPKGETKDARRQRLNEEAAQRVLQKSRHGKPD